MSFLLSPFGIALPYCQVEAILLGTVKVGQAKVAPDYNEYANCIEAKWSAS